MAAQAGFKPTSKREPPTAGFELAAVPGLRPGRAAHARSGFPPGGGAEAREGVQWALGPGSGSGPGPGHGDRDFCLPGSQRCPEVRG